jgi:16S rRNA (guanine527-N7)-methyltransferase
VSAVGSLLQQGLDELGLALSPGSIRRLDAYTQLLLKWNRVYNLTAVRDPEKIVTHHLLDSLAVLPHVLPPRLADVGAGAGLPGVPLAIADSSLQVTLVESNQKKCAFLKQARGELGLENVAIVCQRVQEHDPEKLYNTVICRAFSSLSEFLEGSGRLCAEGGILLAMKGLYPTDELQQLPAGFELEAVPALRVPGLEAERHLVIVRKPVRVVA